MERILQWLKSQDISWPISQTSNSAVFCGRAAVCLIITQLAALQELLETAFTTGRRFDARADERSDRPPRSTTALHPIHSAAASFGTITAENPYPVVSSASRAVALATILAANRVSFYIGGIILAGCRFLLARVGAAAIRCLVVSGTGSDAGCHDADQQGTADFT